MRSIFSSPKIDQNLDKHYYGAWRVLAEGWGDDLYLVDGDDKFHKIEAKGHTTDVKSLWAGRRLTEGDNYWFGPRLFPFDDKSSSKGNSLDTFKATLALVKQQSREELIQLSAHLQNMGDDSMCEILDVVWSCQEFKKKLVEENRSLSEALTWQLARGYDALEGVEPSQTLTEILPKLTPLLSETVKIKKLSVFQKPVASYGQRWLTDALTAGDASQRRVDNPVVYLLDRLKNGELGYKCEQAHKLKRELESYMGECRESRGLGGSGKITHVMKSTYNGSSAGGEYRNPSNDSEGKYSWANQPKIKRKILNELTRDFKNSIYSNGYIDEDCNSLKNYIVFVPFDGPASKFCHELNKLFFGNVVSEKLLIPSSRPL
ncbi:hypothetical protein [Candidatus Mycoplasma haematominutum]|uniref:Uncharacterized protein n=1 Tax=Candidatus Mycoplasma haematominutum 'Birmingham 1' TaxID=1116213 RepID=G8C3M1_9MOLU|nr:hypothetical protein [Candidatus Mycoplasma haematominutum]CCE66919.1 hypothetical protein MHM_04010 [Candidatus Mycoplasma haematominutum 'Birmingham 1']